MRPGAEGWGSATFFLDEVVRVSEENENWSEEGNIIFGDGSG